MSKAETITARAEEWWPRTDQRLAVLVPCFNEETAIARWSPISAPRCREATIYVYDNNSTDRTARGRPRRRRGGAARDATRARATWCGGCSPTSRPTSTCWSTATPPTTRRSVRAMIARLIEDRLDMVVAARVEEEAPPIVPAIAPATGCSPASSPRCSVRRFTDILSGYRVFSRRFVKSFPVLSRGFEIETELTVHALELELPVARGPDALLRAAGRLGVEAQHLARRIAHSVHHRRALPLGAAACVLLRHRHRARGHFRRPRDPDLRDLSRAGHGSARSHRDPFHRPDAAGLSLDRRRSRARYRDPRTARDEAARLSGAAGAGRGAGPADV